MNYLIFDIECSNGNDICSFGYVLADQNFNLIAQKDILINPESKFVLTNRAGTQGIKLAYSAEDFYAAPTFPHYHAFLKQLIEDETCYKIGFAISNDAGFLNRACNRYGLEPINFRFFDIQRLDAKLHNNNAIRGLGKIIEEYGIEQDDENILHKSDDDAFFTMEIFRKMLAETGKDFATVLAERPDCEGVSTNFCVAYNGVAIGNLDKMRKRDAIIFNKYVNELFKQGHGVGGALKGKKIGFTKYFLTHNYRKMLAIAPLVTSLCGKIVPAKQSNLFVVADSMSASQVAYLQKEKPELECITLEQLYSLIGTDAKKVAAAEKKVEIMKFKRQADMLPTYPFKGKKKK